MKVTKTNRHQNKGSSAGMQTEPSKCSRGACPLGKQQTVNKSKSTSNIQAPHSDEEMQWVSFLSSAVSRAIYQNIGCRLSGSK